MNGGQLSGDRAGGKTRPRGARLSIRALTVLVLAIGVVAAIPGPAAAASSAPTTGTVRICNGCAGAGLSDGERYQYVVIHASQYGLISQLKGDNPRIKVLAYKDMAATYSYACHNGVDDAQVPAGIGYCWANANHPEWFLTDTSGARIQFCDYPGLWQMDVGNPSYQRQWLDNVSAEATRLGFDGIVLDDANESESYHLCGRTMASYPTESSYTQQRTASSPTSREAYKVAASSAIPNIYPRRLVVDQRCPFNPGRQVGFLQLRSDSEYFTKWSRDSHRMVHRRRRRAQRLDLSPRRSSSEHKQPGRSTSGCFSAPADDQHSQRYARASFLVDWSGGQSALIYQPSYPGAATPTRPRGRPTSGRRSRPGTRSVSPGVATTPVEP